MVMSWLQKLVRLVNYVAQSEQNQIWTAAKQCGYLALKIRFDKESEINLIHLHTANVSIAGKCDSLQMFLLHSNNLGGQELQKLSFTVFIDT